MKNALILLLFSFGWIANAQTVIYQKGSKIEAKHIDINPKKSFVKADVDGKHIKIKTDAIDSIHIGNQVVKPFLDSGKKRLFSVLATLGNKTLAVNKTDAVRSRGGFESVQSNYQLIIAEAGVVSKTLNFSNSETDREVARRKQIYPFLETEFGGCPRVIAHFTLFRNESDKAILTILNYFDNPEPIICQALK